MSSCDEKSIDPSTHKNTTGDTGTLVPVSTQTADRLLQPPHEREGDEREREKSGKDRKVQVVSRPEERDTGGGEGGQDRKVRVVGQPEEDTVGGEERGLQGSGVLGDSPGVSAEVPGGEARTDTSELSRENTERPTKS